MGVRQPHDQLSSYDGGWGYACLCRFAGVSCSLGSAYWCSEAPWAVNHLCTSCNEDIRQQFPIDYVSCTTYHIPFSLSTIWNSNTFLLMDQLSHGHFINER